MKLKSFCAVAIAAFATSFVFADQGDVLITFSTPGPDKYADGTTVKDGEWYAICWTKNAAFGGLTTAGKPVVKADELILAAPLAKDGKCPFTAFEFARKTKYSSGKFSIFMLDTRDASGNPAKNRAGLFVKEATVATSVAKDAIEAAATATAVVAAGAAGSSAWSKAALQSDAKAATITALEIVGENVKLTVTGLDGTCVIKTGASADAMNEFVLPTVDATDTATFIIPKEKGNFFTAVSVPQAK